jgi:hypothetical protein
VFQLLLDLADQLFSLMIDGLLDVREFTPFAVVAAFKFARS